jgi:hypothetical protein
LYHTVDRVVDDSDDDDDDDDTWLSTASCY